MDFTCVIILLHYIICCFLELGKMTFPLSFALAACCVRFCARELKCVRPARPLNKVEQAYIYDNQYV
jgi:hypothetical protein